MRLYRESSIHDRALGNLTLRCDARLEYLIGMQGGRRMCWVWMTIMSVDDVITVAA